MIFLRQFCLTLAACLVLALVILVPYSCLWLYQSGDVGVERAVEAQVQARASNEMVLFGSGVSQDFVDYKLQLYAATKPRIATVGSSRVMQFRGNYFALPFCNMGGVAGNLAVLRSTIEAMLRIHKPEAVILGLDFWWFLPQWEADPFKEVPPTSGSYVYGLESLRKPWTWLFDGKISLGELFAPITGALAREGRFGIMAQQTGDGFGPDGAWYYTADVTGQKAPFDYQFRDTMTQVKHGIKAFYHARPDQQGPNEAHLDAFAEIYCRLQARGIKVFVFIAPLSQRVYDAMLARKDAYPHLFNLREALLARGIDALDCSNPRAIASSDCEFVDGFHGGEVSYARVLRALGDYKPALLPYLDKERLNVAIRDWKEHALVRDTRLTSLWEQDFMHFDCPKRVPPEAANAGNRKTGN